MEDAVASDRTSYWNTYYKADAAPHLASQFAIFVAGEVQNPSFVIDLGCGNGRDTEFFLSRTGKVISIDQSAAAIETLRRRNDAESLTTICSRIDAPSLPNDLVSNLLNSPVEATGVLYARFFLHAIDHDEEVHFLELCRRVLEARNAIVAVEFRTTKDRNLNKVTAAHYRRYVDPLAFITRASEFDLHPFYFVEGFGFAKFHDDDAHVARILLRRRGTVNAN